MFPSGRQGRISYRWETFLYNELQLLCLALTQRHLLIFILGNILCSSVACNVAMKTRSRLKLPPIASGPLVTVQSSRDVYSLTAIEDSSSDKLSLANKSSVDARDVQPTPSSPSAEKPERKFKRTLKGLASTILAQSVWARQTRLRWEEELTSTSNFHEQSQSAALTFNAKGNLFFLDYLATSSQLTVPFSSLWIALSLQV